MAEIRRENHGGASGFVSGEKQLTVLLSRGCRPRCDQDSGIHLGRITMATDRTRFPGGGDAIERQSKKSRVERIEG